MYTLSIKLSKMVRIQLLFSNKIYGIISITSPNRIQIIGPRLGKEIKNNVSSNIPSTSLTQGN